MQKNLYIYFIFYFLTKLIYLYGFLFSGHVAIPAPRSLEGKGEEEIGGFLCGRKQPASGGASGGRGGDGGPRAKSGGTASTATATAATAAAAAAAATGPFAPTPSR